MTIETPPLSNKASNSKASQQQGVCQAILQRAKLIGYAFTYHDLEEISTYGYLRRMVNSLVDDGKILKLPLENPARFILPEWKHRPEYYCAVASNTNGRVVENGVVLPVFDFVGYLSGLDWSGVLSVHDLRLTFSVSNSSLLAGVAVKGWVYHKRSRSYMRKLAELDCPVTIQLFDTGTVMVTVECSLKPFPLDLDGLRRLDRLLYDVYRVLGGSAYVPVHDGWLISEWHLNRDSDVIDGGGADVYLKFRDFYNQSAQFYHKSELACYRAEVVQSPKATFSALMDTVLSGDNPYAKYSKPSSCSEVTKVVTGEVVTNPVTSPQVTNMVTSGTVPPDIQRLVDEYGLNLATFQAVNDFLAKGKRDKEASA